MQKEETINVKFSNPEVIKSASFDQHEILANIVKLYCPEGIELDPTYSTGNFYKYIKQPKYRYDLNPQVEGVTQSDCRNLPLQKNSIKSMIIDLPFQNTKPVTETEDNDLMHKRFSYIDGVEKLREIYKDSIKEAYRILANNGILIFKCQDAISSGKQYLIHVDAINTAIKEGFYPIDLFVSLRTTVPISPKHSNQKHARKYHSYFLVFKKVRNPVEYKL